MVVEGQKCLQQVLLIPEQQPLGDPPLQIFVGQKDIVHMHDHTLLQSWQDFQEQEVHIPTTLDHVCRVDEQDVVFTKLFEWGCSHLFHFPGDQPFQSWKAPPQLFVWVRFDTRQTRDDH